MRSDIIKTAKVSAILFAAMALFIAGCAAIGLWMFIILLAVVIVALIYGTFSEERWEREGKLAKH
jgi:fatty acid desaturase